MSLHTAVRSSILIGLVAVTGCGPEAPSVRYSGSTLAARPPEKVQVFRTSAPDRPYKELGNVDVSCPTAISGTPYGGGSIEGGCTYEQALDMATERAGESGADAIVGIQTAAGGNGRIVSMQAVAVRFSGPAKPAAPPARPEPPSAEERLRKLKALSDQGLITPDEYARRKAEILEDL